MANKKLVIENLESFEELKEDDFSEISGGLRLAPDYEIPELLPHNPEPILPGPKPLPLPNPKPLPWYPCGCKPWHPKPLPVESADGLVAVPYYCYAIL